MGHGRRMPALFLAHGNPMNAIADNDFTRALSGLSSTLPRPDAVMVVSAHWTTTGTRVLVTETPRTIHDFGGFPDELHDIEYPAPGAPHAAELVRQLAPEVAGDSTWGLDHASWTVLRHIWPDADVPVFELSIDLAASAQEHWDLGARLAPLRDEGVLVVGSGNIVHSFAGIDWRPQAPPRRWAEAFDTWVADALLRGDSDALVHFESAGEVARLSFQTGEHYAPLLYPAAMRHRGEAVSFPYAGIDLASISMRCVRFG